MRANVFIFSIFIFSIVLASLGFLLSTAVLADEEKPYTVQCNGDKCKVDKKTYIGWRQFHATCHVCHGQDAVGTTIAPNLVEKLKQIDKERFMDVVHNGYKGQIGVMPAWKDDPNVNKYFEEFYAYLKARSDGVLGPGRPERIK